MRQHKIFWGSSYDRGLDILLFIWPDVLKEFPDAQLHITYGWDLFDKSAVNNVERQEWKKNIQTLMGQNGITHHGRLGKQELEKVRSSCGVWAYPTYFTEINCITALECQKDGLVPVTTNLAALKETVQSGFKVEGNIRDTKVQKEYLKQLLSVMRDKKLWEKESKKAKKFAKKFDWSKIAHKWSNYFVEPVSQPLVSIITPTIRQGFWHIMSQNITHQTYSNIEWIIVDDFKKDRRDIADEYAKKSGLNIKYIHSPKRAVKRKYGLSSANNIGIQNSNGELLVWLQDFVLMPIDGIERAVDFYRHHPNDLYAPTDVYHKPSVLPDITQEDWFDGLEWFDVIGDFLWSNVRNANMGLRKTNDPFDFEMNYAAIPKSVLTRINGFWEFFDDALGYDNTEIAFRAGKTGSKIFVDDTNVAVCIDHWEALRGHEQNGVNREHNLNDPRFKFYVENVAKGKMSLIRDPKIDEKLLLEYDIPKETSQEGAVEWMTEHMDEITSKWKGLI